MYSSVYKLSVFGIILGAVNLFCTIPLVNYLGNAHNISWAISFAAIIFVVTAPVTLLLVSCALRSAAQDLTMNDETYMTKITDLKKRVEELESKAKL